MHNRIVKTSNESAFKKFIMSRYNETDGLGDEALENALNDLSVGCFTLAFKPEESIHTEAIVMHKFVKNLSTMISKE